MSKKKKQKFTVKSCPFCGGQNIGARYTPYYAPRLQYWVTCFDCHSRTGYFSTPEEAVEAWNKRATEDAVDAITEL